MSTSPAVSILLPCRNAVATLDDCLDSISAQTLGDFELLAIDDGSTDGSDRLLAKRAAGDSRIRVVRAAGRGLVSALNQGLRACRANLVARMDSDDVMRSTRLAEQIERMRAEPEIVVLGSQVAVVSEGKIRDGFRHYVDWQNRCLTAADIRDEIYVESPFAHPSVCLRRDAVLTAGGYRDGAFPEDYELWLRLALLGRRMEKLPRVLLDWRDHPARLSRVDPRCSRTAFDRVRAHYLARDPRVRAAAERLCIWGAGRRTRQRARRLLAAGYRPIAWVDIDPRKIGNRLDGVPVVAPKYLFDLENPFVLSYVSNHGAREQIRVQLEAHGLHRGAHYLCVG